VQHEENAGPGRDAGSCALTGRVALVTGASGGIGTALVTRLLAEGVRVVATTRRPGSPRLAALRGEHPDRLRIVRADMGEPERLPDLVRRVEDESGRLDLLLPNAGVAEVRTLDEVSLAEWRSSLEVNLTAPFVLAQAAAGGMRERGFGRILFTSSVAAYVGGFFGPRWCAVSAGSASSAVIPARASSSITNRHPVQPSTANVTSSWPANRSSHGRSVARHAGSIRLRRTCPVQVSR
jgi:3-oxoacyl-[acyl-carrier protein] reductase